MQYRHEDWDRQTPPVEKPVFGSRFLDRTLTDSAIVSLKFKKGGDWVEGNGFFVNIDVPGARKFVLTAGHNLISAQPHTDLKIRLFRQPGEIDIPNTDVRVNTEYATHPVESSADNDYGVILLPKGVKVPGDFGLSLHLGVADRLDCDLFVTGHRAGSSRGEEPVTSSGRCVNPIVREDQLEYLVATEAGLSGSPVWVGYKTHPTVVAIHNYGPKVMKPGYGSRGTRINLKSIIDILTWTGVDTTAKVLRVSTPEAPQQLPLRLTYSSDDHVFRVVVNERDDPLDTMRVRIFPVYAPPSRQKHTPSAFGFRMNIGGRYRWISWNAPPAATVTLVDDLRQAWPARVVGEDWERGGEFAIVAQPHYGSTAHGATASISGLAVVLEHGKVAETQPWRLQEHGEILDAVGYRKYYRNQPLEDAYDRWILEDAS